MEFSKYQEQARRTDLSPKDDFRGRALPLLGLQRKIGELVSACRENLDRSVPDDARHAIADETGDVLWYLANVASKFGVSLEEAAAINLQETRQRWPVQEEVQEDLFRERSFFDDTFPENERLPRRFRIQFKEVPVQEAVGGRKLQMKLKGLQLGDLLTDNAATDDGYRYHDVLHLSYVASLGWSPVIRSLLRIKRKSNSIVDEVEDGARARDREEAITAFIYENAKIRQLFNLLSAELLQGFPRPPFGVNC